MRRLLFLLLLLPTLTEAQNFFVVRHDSVFVSLDGQETYVTMRSKVLRTTDTASFLDPYLREWDASTLYATIASVNLKAPINNPTFTGTVGGITASMVGLSNVTNESKATMFNNATFTGTTAGITASMIGLGNVTNESKATMFTSPSFTGTPTGITAAHVGLGNVTNESKATMFTSPTLTTPNIGAALGTSLLVTGSIGYTTGAGGTVTQATSKSTGVTLNKITGEIVMNAAALAAATIVTFTLTNSTIAAKDAIVLNHVTTGTQGAYTLSANPAAGSATISVRNNTAGSLGEAIVIRYTIIKSVNN